MAKKTMSPRITQREQRDRRRRDLDRGPRGRGGEDGRKRSRGRSRERRRRPVKIKVEAATPDEETSDDSERETLRTGSGDDSELTPDVVEIDGPEVDGSGGDEEGEAMAGNETNHTQDRRAGGRTAGSQSSYFTRSKGPPGSAKRNGRSLSAPKRTPLKECWADPSTEEDDEENIKGRNIDIGTRRAVLAQRQRREREKRQKKNREWMSKSQATLAILGEEGGTDTNMEQDEGQTQVEAHGNDLNTDHQTQATNQTDQGPPLGPPGQHPSDAGQAQQMQQLAQSQLPCSRAGPSTSGGTSESRSDRPAPDPITTYRGQSKTVKHLANAVNDHCAGSGGDVLDAEVEDMEEVDGQFVRLNMTLDAMEADKDEDVIFEVADLVSPEIDIGPGGQIRVTDVVSFVVLKFDEKVDKDWTLPSPGLFQELLARVACVCLEYDIACYRAYKWGTLWGKVGLLGLSSNSLKDIQEYRIVIEDQIFRGIRFTLFPKEALEKRGNLTVLLRENLSTFNTHWLPKAILIRSRMRGGLRLTHIKHFTKEDRTRDGASKEGWRLAMLQGCPEFMEELRKFDQEHRFPIGAGHVVIRGGAGRPKGTIERVRGSRAGKQRHQKHQSDEDQPRQQQRPERRRNDDNRTYDRNFPAWGRNREHDRDRDRSSAGNRGGRDQSASAAWGKNGPRHGRSAR